MFMVVIRGYFKLKLKCLEGRRGGNGVECMGVVIVRENDMHMSVMMDRMVLMWYRG